MILMTIIPVMRKNKIWVASLFDFLEFIFNLASLKWEVAVSEVSYYDVALTSAFQKQFCA
ncbi:hypothetical protein VT85_17470 [Planctomyces sp. SH-PL62]|nr:hypothetical protein VT85_17470 [Planctomyces sp. SH-PL62]